MSLFLRPILGGSLPPIPISSQALSWGEQRSLGLTVLGGGRTHTYSQCLGDGGRGSTKEGGACYPKGRDPPTPTVPSPAPILGGWVDRQTDRVRHHRKAAPSTVRGCQSPALWSMRGGNYGARERQDSTCVRVCVCSCVFVCVCWV